MKKRRGLTLLQKRNVKGFMFILPWLVLVAMTIRDGPFREFYSTPLGLAVVGVGGLMSLGGARLVSRLGRMPEEPRVLGR